MNTFLADLHIHSRYSRATSARLTVPHLAAWSVLKGLSVTATGDFTHPAWRQELREWLVRDDATGLYRLNRPVNMEDAAPGYAAPAPCGLPQFASAESGPLFMLQAEISSIYKKDGAVRKVHNLVYMPDLDAVERLCEKLGAIGNLNADGRPILGLDSQRLLEIVLETAPSGVVIPAHAWTPWFSVFGSKSGFDSLEACFGDLTPHIFALETGLSSDPDMNRLWSGLDKLAMISNSDCHSGENLGREATLFSGTPGYDALFNALRAEAHGTAGNADPCRYEGTLEFFPEEGKYHLDGHRACNVVLSPEETRRHKGLCPVCGKPVTVGVLNRIMTLADREAPQPPAGSGFVSLVPLPELIGEILCTGSKSRKVQARHAELIQHFGPELHILREEAVNKLGAYWPELGEAVRRMREGQVHRQAGYDGEYGTVRMFSDEERLAFAGGVKAKRGVLVNVPPKARQSRKKTVSEPKSAPAADPDPAATLASEGTLLHSEGPTAAQQEAIAAGPCPVLVLAGPGAGKTRTLIARLTHLLATGVPASSLVAVTFTRRAAAELQERLRESMGESTGVDSLSTLPHADTLHALALHYWPASPNGLASSKAPCSPAILSEELARAAFLMANEGADNLPSTQAALRQHCRTAFDTLALHRERRTTPAPELTPLAERYTAYKRARNQADYTDLLEMWLERLRSGDLSPPWAHVLVDEIQDLSPLQLELVRALLPADGSGFFGIGDPDQAIYGFRGAHPDVAGALATLWPDLRTLHLSHSYRAGQDILTSASAILGESARCGVLSAARALPTRLVHFSAPDAAKEAFRVADEISILLGSGSHTLNDAAAKSDNPLAGVCSPSDIAVLVRMKALIPPLREALFRRGIPVSVPEVDPFWAETRVALLLGLAGRRYGLPMPYAVPDPSDLPARAWSDGPDGLLRAVEATPPFDATVRTSGSFRALKRLFQREGSWQAVLSWIRLRQEIDLVRESAETVRIMTLHAAKGLEFRAVFLPCLEEGVLPLNTSLFSGGSLAFAPDPDADADERRLLYVGLTRAAELAFLSSAAKRRLFGRELALPPSRYLRALPACVARAKLVLKRSVEQRQLKLF